MKKVLLALTVLFCAVIVFFTLFGEKLYYATTPTVTLTRVSNEMIDENGYVFLVIPKSCIFENKYIYGLSSYPGFSMTLYSVNRQEIEVFPNPNDDSTVLVRSGLKQNQIIVIGANKELSDGEHVVLK